LNYKAQLNFTLDFFKPTSKTCKLANFASSSQVHIQKENSAKFVSFHFLLILQVIFLFFLITWEAWDKQQNPWNQKSKPKLLSSQAED
jgi:hypothetical protein